MKKPIFLGVVLTLIIATLNPLVAAKADSSSFTGGLISENLTLTKENSPYLITSTISIPVGKVLSIEAGVKLKAITPIDLFWVQGKLVFNGTKKDPVRIDGSTSSYFYLKGARTAEIEAKFLHVYGANTGSLIPATGHEQYATLDFTDCEFLNIPGFNYLWYPNRVNFTRNVFANMAGFSIGTRNSTIIKDNLFSKDPVKNGTYSYWIDVWNGTEVVVISGNEFRSLTQNALIGTVSFNASSNFWQGISSSEMSKYVMDVKNNPMVQTGTVDISNPLSGPVVESPKLSVLVQEAEAKAAAELKAKQEAEAKAAAELKAKQEAEAKAAAELKAAGERIISDAKAEAARILAAAKAAVAKKKVTITCIKGKLIKKVTAVKPLCPKGYKKK